MGKDLTDKLLLLNENKIREHIKKLLGKQTIKINFLKKMLGTDVKYKGFLLREKQKQRSHEFIS